MPIQVNQENDSALTALAAGRSPSLNLPLWGIDESKYTQPLFDSNQKLLQNQGQLNVQNAANAGELARQNAINSGQLAVQNAANLGSANEQTLRNSGQLANTNALTTQETQQAALNRPIQQQLANQVGQANANQFTLGQQQNANAAQQTANTGAYQSGELNIDQQKVQQDAQMNHFKAVMALNSQQITKLGAFSNAFRQSMMAAQSPEEQQQITAHFQQLGQAEGVLSPQQAAQFNPADPYSAMTQASYWGNMAGMAKTGQSQGLAVGAGGQFMMRPGPNGSVTMSLPNTPEQQSKLTDELNKSQQQSQQIATLKQQYQDNGLTWDQGAAKPLTTLVGGAESATGIHTGPGTYSDLEQQKTQWNANAQQLNVGYLSNLDPNFKYTNRSQNLVNDIAIKPGDNPTVKMAKLNAIDQANQVQQQALVNRAKFGTPLSSVNSQLDTVASNYYKSVGQPSTYTDSKGTQWSTEQIQQAATAKGISLQDAIAKMGAQPSGY